MADPVPSDAGNDPAGRSDPSKGPLGLSWLMWGGVAIATFAAVWFLRGRSSGIVSSPTTGAASGDPSGTGVLSGDPMTEDALLNAINALNATLAKGSGNSVQPHATPPPPHSLGGGAVIGGHYDPHAIQLGTHTGTTPRVATGRTVSTSRLTGKTSISRVAHAPAGHVRSGIVSRLGSTSPGFRDVGPLERNSEQLPLTPGLSVPLTPWGPTLKLSRTAPGAKFGGIQLV